MTEPNTLAEVKREAIKRVVVVSSPYKPSSQDVARAIITWLQGAGINADQPSTQTASPLSAAFM